MKRLKHVFSYSPVTGVEAHRVRDQRRDSLVRECGLSGEVLRVRELNGPGARYYTTPVLAIEAFIAKAEAALADTSKREHHADWRRALRDAQRDLSSHIRATRDV